ncbi:MAG: Cyclopropane-fatty-acyl-phospholipid synthase [Pseudomonadota bacterium]
MKSSELVSPRTLSPALEASWPRQALHALLGRLQHGHLRLEESGHVLEFGEPRAQARLKATVQIKDPAAYRAMLSNGSVGAGEAYMQGLWDTPDLLEVIRLFVVNMEVVHGMKASPLRAVGLRLFHWLRRNDRARARDNIAAHYDLSNDFFKLFLDDTLAYSSGIFLHETATLAQASLAKFRRLCDKLELKPGDHLLEIGTGWGGLAVFAAKHYGCRVTTTTLSHQQYLHAKAWVEREGLADRITLLEKDYRDLEGQFDKLVSVEMIEAVGAEYYPAYFSQCSRLLKSDGLMMIQAITISDQRYKYSLANTDFIKRYIFPGGQLPCNAAFTRHLAEQTDMQLIDLHDITRDYALTLRAWRDRFQEQLPAVRQLGFDEVFIRMWRFYFCFCEGGFLERVIHTAQFLCAKPGYRPVRD